MRGAHLQTLSLARQFDFPLAWSVLLVQDILLVAKDTLLSLLICVDLLVELQFEIFSLRQQPSLKLREIEPLIFQLRRQRVSLLPLELCFA